MSGINTNQNIKSSDAEKNKLTLYNDILKLAEEELYQRKGGNNDNNGNNYNDYNEQELTFEQTRQRGGVK
jgi:hypothetical protein